MTTQLTPETRIRDRSIPTGQDYPPRFALIGGDQVDAALRGRERQIVDIVEETYRVHGAGDSVNPPSYFLRFEDRPLSRIIALPASVGGRFRVDGLKWVSSFPGNIEYGLPRASALLLLNDHDTGYPFACLEASIISASRTAASAALGAQHLSPGQAAAAARRFRRGGSDRALHPRLSVGDGLGVRRDRHPRPGAGERAGAGRRVRPHGLGPGAVARRCRVADPCQRPRGLRDGGRSTAHHRHVVLRPSPGGVARLAA